MVKIRLTRLGKKKKPFYRVVVCDIRTPRDGKFIEKIGTYDVFKTPPLAEIDKERANYWLSKGAQLSPTVKNIFVKENIL
ncbi:MAG: 30S ribosomal protein S16 [Candidatus Omnitrophica bacterium]|nr:30S ribosomal protein S16 [Candidatus Omnitrophota bacterium]